MNDSSLSQLVNSPTRGKNILDLYFTNNPTLARQVKMIPGIGDHHSAIMVDSLIKPMVNKLQSRNGFIAVSQRRLGFYQGWLNKLRTQVPIRLPENEH